MASLGRALGRELAPAPGRFGNALRVVAVVLALLAVFETFRIPEAALACFIAVFLSQDNEAASVLTAAIVGVAGIAGMLLAIVLFGATLGEPALRLTVIAAMTFATMFLSRAMVLGVPAFVAGFLAAYGLTYGDQVAAFGLLPGSVANTAEFSLPEIAFVPPEEALLRTLLWLLLVIGLSAGGVAVANLLTGRDPALMLRAALAERLATVTLATRLEAEAEAVARLEGFAREGAAGLERLAELSGKIHPPTARSRSDAALIEPVLRLVLVVLVWSRSGRGGRAGLEAAGGLAERVRRGVIEGRGAAGPGAVVPAQGDPVLRPLAGELGETLGRLEEAFSARDLPVAPAADETRRRGRLFKADAWTNPDYPRFGFKVTLAAMLCYLAYAGAHWPQIHTATVTCFFVALGTEGETLHKATLRICGCLVGAGLGIGTIVLAMPAMTDLGDLLIAVGSVVFLAAWVSNGSPRIAYAGVQIALAYVLVVLQGFGPTLDMQTGRDRVIGILFGTVVVSTIFATIWPVRVGAAVRARLAAALETLAQAVAAVGARADLRPFAEAVAAAKGLAADAAFEPGTGARGEGPEALGGLLRNVQALVVPVAVVLRLGEKEMGGLPEEARVAVASYHRALAAWLQEVAGRVRHGERMAAARPVPPVLAGEAVASQAAWYGRLDRELGTALAPLLGGERAIAAG